MNEDVFREGKKLGIYEDILKAKNIKLYIGYTKDNLIKFSSLVKSTKNLLIYKPSIKAIPKEYFKFRTSLLGFQLGMDNIEEFSELAVENIRCNEAIGSKGINEFFKEYSFENEPVILVAAGPSLDESLEELKKLSGKLKIFAVGSALNTLMLNKIKPDMFCIIDGSQIIEDQIKGYEDLDIPMCYLSTASRWAVKAYKGPRFIFYNEENKDKTIIETGKSVATAIFSIAIKGRAKRIIFVGQDLGFKGNRTHTRFFPHNNMSLKEDYKDRVESVDGGYLNTNSQLLYYKNWFENRIKEIKNIEFINCSKGARIIGTKEMNLEEVLD